MGLFPNEAIAPSTWANGFGVWHACVPASGNRRSRDAHMARKLIKSELEARDELRGAPLVIVLDHETEHGTLVYREKV